MKKSIIILFHSVYWLLYALFVVIVLGLIKMNQPNESIIPKHEFILMFGSLTVAPAVCGFYIFYTVLFDYFLSKKRIFLLFVGGFAAAWLSGAVGAAFMELMHRLGFLFSPFDGNWDRIWGNINIMAIIALPNGGMGLILRGFIRWFSEIKMKEDLQKKNFDTELALIKSQLDPHFLFNTLNNIDALILKDKDTASLYLHKLSDIMRFMLYETKGEKIPLSKEVEYIEKYVGLQKIRTANTDFVALQMSQNTEGVEIAPMILIPFVENAFKHAERVKTGNAISIKIKVVNGHLYFECNNRFDPNDKTEKEVGGLGNNLIIKRLELLYPKKHTLKIEEKENLFCVNLTIDLT